VEGTEHPPKPSEKPHFELLRAAKSGAVDADLASLIALWTQLPVSVRKALLHLARATGNG
jgi:hypothetical protein